jgi:hypothetical protein
LSDNHPLSDKALPGLSTGDPLVDQYLRAARAGKPNRRKFGQVIPDRGRGLSKARILILCKTYLSRSTAHTQTSKPPPKWNMPD